MASPTTRMIVTQYHVSLNIEMIKNYNNTIFRINSNQAILRFYNVVLPDDLVMNLYAFHNKTNLIPTFKLVI